MDKNSNQTKTSTMSDQNNRIQHPRLKKSYSECEYYGNINSMDRNYNLSPSKQKVKEYQGLMGEDIGQIQHNLKQQTQINGVTFLDDGGGGGGNNFLYHHDTLKSQYLLQQQQKLKEYKNDPNYLPNGDNCSASESSTETRGILKNNTKGSDSSKNSLKRNKGLSTLSLCSCDADTEVIPNQSRPLYQYSLDRKKPLHTYTCEQNAQILLRLEKERQKKYGSIGRLHFTAQSGTDQITQNKHQRQKQPNCTIDNESFMYPETNHIENETFIDTIPPPPPPLKRNPSLNKHHQQHQQQLQQQQQQQINNNTTNNQGLGIVNSAINQNPSSEYPAAGVVFELPSNKPDLFNFANNNPNIVECKANFMSDGTLGGKQQQQHQITSMPTTITTQTDILANGNNCQAKVPFPVFYCDDNYHPSSYDKENVNSFYLYHHEPASYLPNYDNISSNKIPDKYNTIDCGMGIPLQTYNIPISKFHSSTCNLNNQFNSSNLINGHHFSNSLSNFNMLNPHQQLPNYYNFNPSFTQLPDGVNGIPGAFGSSSIMGSSFASNISLNGTPKSHQQNMPWKHRPSSRSSSSGTNSSKWDLPSRQWLALTSILLIAGAASVAVPLALSVTASSPFEERMQAATQLLVTVPLIDGHNDLPWNIRKFMHNQLNEFRFDDDLTTVPPWSKSSWSHTDLPRLKRGRVAAQFWAAYVPCEAQYKDAVQITLEQIDVIERLTDRYSPQLIKCTSVYGSLFGVEGGHALGGSLGVLRTYYSLGVRYMTLTSTCNTPWADSSNADAPKYDIKHGGLTSYGKIIVREMNRLGMIVDLSKTSVKSMKDVLEITEAPVIFSHSSAFELCNSSRNVKDEILELVTKNRGLVMVNFYNKFLTCNENASVSDAVAHINHIKRVAGIDHVGLGAGFDGINYTPKGIEDVSTYPTLFAELMGQGWTIEDLTKLAGANLLRVMSEVERVRDTKKMNNEKPYEEIPNFRLPLQTSEEQYNCSNNSL